MTFHFIMSSSTRKFEHAIDTTSTLLRCTWPRLKTVAFRRLTLDASEDDFPEFLQRHQSVLKALTLESLHFYYSPTAHDLLDSLAVVLRFILLLGKEGRLDRMCFVHEIAIRYLHDSLSHKNRGIFIRQAGEAFHKGTTYEEEVEHPTSVQGSLRHEIEEYICHRGQLPFHGVRPYVQRVIDKDVSYGSRTGTITIGRIGPRAFPEMDIPLRSDDTFELVGDEW